MPQDPDGDHCYGGSVVKAVPSTEDGSAPRLNVDDDDDEEHQVYREKASSSAAQGKETRGAASVATYSSSSSSQKTERVSHTTNAASAASAASNPGLAGSPRSQQQSPERYQHVDMDVPLVSTVISKPAVPDPSTPSQTTASRAIATGTIHQASTTTSGTISSSGRSDVLPSYKDQARSVADPSSGGATVSVIARRVIRGKSPSRPSNNYKSQDDNHPAASHSSEVSSSGQDWTEDPSESEQQQQGSVIVPIIRVDVVSDDDDGNHAGSRSLPSASVGKVYNADAFALTGGIFVKRRCVIVTIAVLLLVVAGAVSGICGAGLCSSSSKGGGGGGGDDGASRPIEPPSSSPSSAPSMPVRNITAIVDYINLVTFANKTITYPAPVDLATPEEMALQWLIDDDPLEMSIESSNYLMRLTQRYALATLWYSLKGVAWLAQTGWLENENECAWHGIGCVSGKVTTIGEGGAYQENNLSGSIPTDLALLTAVDVINFASNRGIRGSLPQAIGNLSLLTYFDITECGLRYDVSCQRR